MTRELKRSKAYFEKVKEVIPGGVNSNTRSEAVFPPHPVYFEKGEGAYLFDLDGNKYIDYVLSWGPLILGHRPKEIVKAVTSQIEKRGALYWPPANISLGVAEKIIEAVPSIESVRIGNSGSEVAQAAIRVARAATGREMILKFEGQYHGWLDPLYYSVTPTIDANITGTEMHPKVLSESAGIPNSVSENQLVATWNNKEALEQIVKRYKYQIAAIIAEPVATYAGGLLPKEDWLPFLRKITEDNGIILILDEVMTGMRYKGCAQGYFGVTPDITILAKALGAGFPIAAFGGKKELMDLLVTNHVMHGGTYNGNLVGLSAANAFLDIFLNNEKRFNKNFDLGNELGNKLAEIISDAGFNCIRGGFGPRFSIMFSDKKDLNNWREVKKFALTEKNISYYHQFWEGMAERGILLHPRPGGVSFLSTAHTKEEVNVTLKAAADSIARVNK